MTGSRYLEPEIETMPRRDLERLQEAKLLDLLPWAYERSPLVRATWDTARVSPREIRSLDDFRNRAPFLSKDAIRGFRDRHDDPYGGLLCVEEDSLQAVQSTSGTTGDPTLVPERWNRAGAPPLARELHEIGVKPGDFVTCMLFTFRGPFWEAFHSLGAVPMFLDHTPFEFPRLIELSLRHRPTALYTLSSVLVTMLIHMEESLGADLCDVFSSYAGAVIGGEPLGSRAAARVREWGLETFEHTSLGDVGAATECREHAGCHFFEDTAFVEHLAPDGADAASDGADAASDGARGELVVTALENRVAPLVRYRSDDLVELTRERCACGRTHGRLRTIGRKGDEVVVDGRSVLPRDVWGAIESIEETSMALFQLVRPRRELERLRLRVGCDGGAGSRLRERVIAAVAEAIGLVPDVELVANAELLRLGPPHKIPRVTRA